MFCGREDAVFYKVRVKITIKVLFLMGGDGTHVSQRLKVHCLTKTLNDGAVSASRLD